MKPWWIAFLVASTWVGGLHADEAADVVDKAIRAQYGSADKLSKGAKVVSRYSGTIFSGNPIPSVRDTMAEWPYRCRVGVTLTIGGQRKGVELATDGPTGWKHGSGQPSEALGAADQNEVGGDMFATGLGSLAPLKAEGLKLTAGPAGVKVTGRATKAIQVSSPGRPEVLLYFDAESYKLLRIAYRWTEQGKKVDKDIILGDHREVDGVLVPHKVTEYIDRKPVGEWKLDEIKFPTELPKGAFDRPE